MGQLHEIVNEHGLRVTAEISYHVVYFLDVIPNSRNDHQPNTTTHGISMLDLITLLKIIKQIPKSIKKRLSSLLSNGKSFKTSMPLYEEALNYNSSNYNTMLTYRDITNVTT